MLLLNSYAKLNLYLEVLELRKDSYHNLKTLFERIDLADKIILKPREDKKIKIICNSADVPCDNTNLAYRSAKLLQDRFNIHRGVDIKIIKRIPVGAGLGGGSSNAATALLGLNILWRLELKQAQLLNLARAVGSDVGFFIYNCPFAWGSGRGDRIKPLKSLNNLRLWHILVAPKIKVSTPFIYKEWDKYFKGKKTRLTSIKYNAKMLNLTGRDLFNRLEIITAKLYPQVRQVKDKLRDMGVKSILMSGSGPAVFGIVSSRKEAVSLKAQLKADSNSWQVFAVKTV